ncbi:1-deoxy-D-xylulose-5-phosphate synthase [Boudabousia tangfeifanii]|uniref:1-deoxy-D-xylulose-5-phosphate synthase n=1 Tax=Boudabousia tangfeifanii TaxID=1912795 RepID=A0A1D9MM75_9ACTO|nr:1-deoxy-D-xylulose-5-phosphate synthase [Boudabousia tangfeifanii]AOZ73471.1 1-deoxy-D-xylulose-5-phosphate synthase [Boudabousia tangfeifanii]
MGDTLKVKDLDAAKKAQLAQEIRDYLIAAVSQTGGHMGPNLGVVELTMALHAAFESPKDTLLFDTGHQAYVHKLLTGRHDFSSLRQTGGISGYPSRAESKHDVIENSHASTALSWANGVALGKKLNHDDSYTVAVIGDGAMTGGMAWEALNNISALKKSKLIIVVNDNGRSYAPTVGGLSHHLNTMRTNPKYERTLAQIKSMLLSAGRGGELAYDALHSMKKGLKDLVAPQAMFEDLGLKYLGPFDGHDLNVLETAFNQAKTLGEPVIVHVSTQKGRGYVPAEEDVADRFHAVGKIHPETGLPVAPSRFGWTAVFADEIVKAARVNPKLVGVSAAMIAPVGLAPMLKEFPDRVYDVGIAEQHAATMCAGLSYAGYHPVFAVYATFLNRAFDQVLFDIALHGESVTIVLDRAGATGDDGASHNGMWDLALFRLVPNLAVAAPRDEETLRAVLREAFANEQQPTLVRYPKGALPTSLPALASGFGAELIATTTATNESKAVAQKENPWLLSDKEKQLVIIAVGPTAHQAVAAVEEIKDATGWQVRVVDPGWLYPIRDEFVLSLQAADAVMTLEDGVVSGGYGEALATELRKTKPEIKVKSLGIPDEFLPHQTRTEIWDSSHLNSRYITLEAIDLLK